MRTLRALPRSAALALRTFLPLARLEQRARRLELKRRPDFEGRSRRLRYHLLKRLDPAFELDEADTPQLASVVRRRLKEVTEPVRRLAWVVLAGSGASLLAVALVIGALCGISSSARAYFFPPDLAARAKWQLSSAFPGLPTRGVGAGSAEPLFFHTDEETNAAIELTFPRPVKVKRVRIRNREDCCEERALPLNVEALGPQGEQLLCQRRAPFSSWTCHADGVRTQRLRIRHPGFGTLHLARIEVYE